MRKQKSEEKNLTNKIRKKQIEKLEKEKKDWKQSSNSRVLIKYLLIYFIEIISWAIIAFFVYVWWNQMGQPIGCDRISPELCNSCFIRR